MVGPGPDLVGQEVAGQNGPQARGAAPAAAAPGVQSAEGVAADGATTATRPVGDAVARAAAAPGPRPVASGTDAEADVERLASPASALRAVGGGRETAGPGGVQSVSAARGVIAALTGRPATAGAPVPVATTGEDTPGPTTATVPAPEPSPAVESAPALESASEAVLDSVPDEVLESASHEVPDREELARAAAWTAVWQGDRDAGERAGLEEDVPDEDVVPELDSDDGSDDGFDTDDEDEGFGFSSEVDVAALEEDFAAESADARTLWAGLKDAAGDVRAGALYAEAYRVAPYLSSKPSRRLVIGDQEELSARRLQALHTAHDLHRDPGKTRADLAALTGSDTGWVGLLGGVKKPRKRHAGGPGGASTTDAAAISATQSEVAGPSSSQSWSALAGNGPAGDTSEADVRDRTVGAVSASPAVNPAPPVRDTADAAGPSSSPSWSTLAGNGPAGDTSEADVRDRTVGAVSASPAVNPAPPVRDTADAGSAVAERAPAALSGSGSSPESPTGSGVGMRLKGVVPTHGAGPSGVFGGYLDAWLGVGRGVGGSASPGKGKGTAHPVWDEGDPERVRGHLVALVGEEEADGLVADAWMLIGPLLLGPRLLAGTDPVTQAVLRRRELLVGVTAYALHVAPEATRAHVITRTAQHTTSLPAHSAVDPNPKQTVQDVETAAGFDQQASALRRAVKPLRRTVRELVPTDQVQARQHLEQVLDTQEAVLDEATTPDDLARIENGLGEVFRAVEAWRAARTGRPLPGRLALPKALLSRPEWYEILVARVITTVPKVTHLPSRPPADTGEADPSNLAVRSRGKARAVLNQRVVALANAYGLASAQLAVAHETGYLTGLDPLDAAAVDGLGTPDRAQCVAAAQRVKKARAELEAALDAVDRQLEDHPEHPWEAAAHEEGWQPEHRFQPPEYLTGQNPVLGHDVPEAVSDRAIATIREEIRTTLPPVLRSEANLRLIEQRTTREKLLSHAEQLVGDRYTFEVAGHQVAVRLKPAAWKQRSDPVELRLKTTDHQRALRGRDRGHGYFADANLNVGYALETFEGTHPFQLNYTEAFKGVFTIVTGEHQENANISVQTVQERTVKNSSYQSLLFSYDATVHVEVHEPQRTSLYTSLLGRETVPHTWRNGQNGERPRVKQALEIWSSRETVRPVDGAAKAVQGSEHVPSGTGGVSVVAKYAETDELTGRHLPVPIPANSLVESFPGGAQLREVIEQAAGELAPPGTAQRRRLDAQTSPVGLKNLVHPAVRKQGYTISFGDHEGRTPAALNVKLRLTRPEVKVTRDTSTWMDIDDRVTRIAEWALAHEDSIDIPPGLMLFALNFAVMSKDSLTPWLWFWPTLDAEMAHTGAGMATTEFTGVRYVGESTTVSSFAVEAVITRTDRPQDEPIVVQLDDPMWLRSLSKDAKEWAKLPEPPSTEGTPEPAPVLKLADGIGLNFGNMHRFSELEGADDLLENVEQELNERFPGLLPSPDGNEHWNQGVVGRVLDNKFAGTNQRRLHQALHPDTLRAHRSELMSADGYSVVLSKAHVFGPEQEDVTVRIRAEHGKVGEDGAVIPAEPKMSAWLPDSELDVNRTEEQDSTLAAATILGAWLGPQATYSIGEAKSGPLQAAEVRPMLHGRKVRVKGVASGQATWGMQGFALDGLAEFSGSLVLTASIEHSSDQHPAPAPAVPQSHVQEPEPAHLSQESGDHIVIEMGVLGRRSELPGSFPGTETDYSFSTVSEVRHLPPVQVDYKVLVPANLTHKKVVDPSSRREVWVPFDAAELGTKELVWRREEGRLEFPNDIWVDAGPGGLAAAVFGEFKKQGHIHVPAHVRSDIEAHVATAVKAMPTLQQRETLVWKGTIAHQSVIDKSLTGLQVHAEVLVRAVVDEVRTVALPQGFGTYLDSGAASFIEVGRETSTGFYAGLRARFPMKFGQDTAHHSEEEFQPWTLTPQPQAFYRRENALGTFSSTGGSLARLTMEGTATAAGPAKVRYQVQVRTWCETRLISYGRQETSTEVEVTGEVLMSAMQATALGLMPKGLEVRLDTSVPYELPAEQIGDLGDSGIVSPPDAGAVVTEVTDWVEQKYGKATADAVADGIGKVLGPMNTAGAMDLLVHGHQITVPVVGRAVLASERLGVKLPTLFPVDRTFTIELKAELSEPKFLGRVPYSRIGKRYTAETTAGESSRRAARYGVDPVRFWYNKTTMGEGYRSFWQNVNLTRYGQTARKAGLTTSVEHKLGTTLERQGLTSADFSRKVSWSAVITVETAPSAMVDAATLGSFQTTVTQTVHAQQTSTLTTRHDVAMLNEVSHPDRSVEPTQADAGQIGNDEEAQAVQPHTIRPDWAPQLPDIDRTLLPPQTRLSELREGLDLSKLQAIEPDVLGRVEVLRFQGLREFGDKVYRLILPEEAAYPKSISGPRDAAGYAKALWQNFVSNPPPGASWFNPRSNLRGQVSATVNPAFLGGQIKGLLTGGVEVGIEIPGRFSTLKADLELLTDVVRVRDGNRSVDESFLTEFDATSQRARIGTEALSGWFLGTWLMPDFHLPGKAEEDIIGPMLGLDYLTWHSTLGMAGAQQVHSGGKKTTGRSLRLLHLDVRWKAALVPENPSLWFNPGEWLNPAAYRGKSSETFTDDTIRRISVWVPEEDAPLFLGLGRQQTEDQADSGTHMITPGAKRTGPAVASGSDAGRVVVDGLVVPGTAARAGGGGEGSARPRDVQSSTAADRVLAALNGTDPAAGAPVRIETTGEDAPATAGIILPALESVLEADGMLFAEPDQEENAGTTTARTLASREEFDAQQRVRREDVLDEDVIDADPVPELGSGDGSDDDFDSRDEEEFAFSPDIDVTAGQSPGPDRSGGRSSVAVEAGVAGSVTSGVGSDRTADGRVGPTVAGRVFTVLSGGDSSRSDVAGLREPFVAGSLAGDGGDVGGLFGAVLEGWAEAGKKRTERPAETTDDTASASTTTATDGPGDVAVGKRRGHPVWDEEDPERIHAHLVSLVGQERAEGLVGEAWTSLLQNVLPKKGPSVVIATDPSTREMLRRRSRLAAVTAYALHADPDTAHNLLALHATTRTEDTTTDTARKSVTGSVNGGAPRNPAVVAIRGSDRAALLAHRGVDGIEHLADLLEAHPQLSRAAIENSPPWRAARRSRAFAEFLTTAGNVTLASVRYFSKVNRHSLVSWVNELPEDEAAALTRARIHRELGGFAIVLSTLPADARTTPMPTKEDLNADRRFVRDGLPGVSRWSELAPTLEAFPRLHTSLEIRTVLGVALVRVPAFAAWFRETEREICDDFVRQMTKPIPPLRFQLFVAVLADLPSDHAAVLTTGQVRDLFEHYRKGWSEPHPAGMLAPVEPVAGSSTGPGTREGAGSSSGADPGGAGEITGARTTTGYAVAGGPVVGQEVGGAGGQTAPGHPDALTDWFSILEGTATTLADTSELTMHHDTLDRLVARHPDLAEDRAYDKGDGSLLWTALVAVPALARVVNGADASAATLDWLRTQEDLLRTLAESPAARSSHDAEMIQILNQAAADQETSAGPNTHPHPARETGGSFFTPSPTTTAPAVPGVPVTDAAGTAIATEETLNAADLPTAVGQTLTVSQTESLYQPHWGTSNPHPANPIPAAGVQDGGVATAGPSAAAEGGGGPGDFIAALRGYLGGWRRSESGRAVYGPVWDAGSDGPVGGDSTFVAGPAQVQQLFDRLAAEVGNVAEARRLVGQAHTLVNQIAPVPSGLNEDLQRSVFMVFLNIARGLNHDPERTGRVVEEALRTKKAAAATAGAAGRLGLPAPPPRTRTEQVRAVEALQAWQAAAPGRTGRMPKQVETVAEADADGGAVIGRWFYNVGRNMAWVTRETWAALHAAGLQPTRPGRVQASEEFVRALADWAEDNPDATEPDEGPAFEDAYRQPQNLRDYWQAVRAGDATLSTAQYRELGGAAGAAGRLGLPAPRTRADQVRAVEALQAWQAADPGRTGRMPGEREVVVPRGAEGSAVTGQWFYDVGRGLACVSRETWAALHAAGLQRTGPVRVHASEEFVRALADWAEDNPDATEPDEGPAFEDAYRQPQNLRDYWWAVRAGDATLSTAQYRELGGAAGAAGRLGLPAPPPRTRTEQVRAVEALQAWQAAAPGRTGLMPKQVETVAEADADGAAVTGRWFYNLGRGRGAVSRETLAALVAAGMPSIGVVQVPSLEALLALLDHIAAGSAGLPAPGEGGTFTTAYGQEFPLGGYFDGHERFGRVPAETVGEFLKAPGPTAEVLAMVGIKPGRKALEIARSVGETSQDPTGQKPPTARRQPQAPAGGTPGRPAKRRRTTTTTATAPTTGNPPPPHRQTDTTAAGPGTLAARPTPVPPAGGTGVGRAAHPWLSPAQNQYLSSSGQTLYNPPGDGDCFYHALLAAAPAQTFTARGIAPTPLGLRTHLANRLRAELAHPTGPQRPLWNALEESQFPVLEGMAWTNPHLPDEAHADAVRAGIADAIATPRNWHDRAGDITPYLARLVFGIDLRRLDPDGALETLARPHFPPTTGPSVTLVNNYERHWMALQPPTHPEPDTDAAMDTAMGTDATLHDFILGLGIDPDPPTTGPASAPADTDLWQFRHSVDTPPIPDPKAPRRPDAPAAGGGAPALAGNQDPGLTPILERRLGSVSTPEGSARHQAWARWQQAFDDYTNALSNGETDVDRLTNAWNDAENALNVHDIDPWVLLQEIQAWAGLAAVTDSDTGQIRMLGGAKKPEQRHVGTSGASTTGPTTTPVTQSEGAGPSGSRSGNAAGSGAAGDVGVRGAARGTVSAGSAVNPAPPVRNPADRSGSAVAERVFAMLSGSDTSQLSPAGRGVGGGPEAVMGARGAWDGGEAGGVFSGYLDAWLRAEEGAEDPVASGKGKGKGKAHPVWDEGDPGRVREHLMSLVSEDEADGLVTDAWRLIRPLLSGPDLLAGTDPVTQAELRRRALLAGVTAYALYVDPEAAHAVISIRVATATRYSTDLPGGTPRPWTEAGGRATDLVGKDTDRQATGAGLRGHLM
ncbi:hypothetical protein BX266_5483 [Streptomyces sp. TLI_171]|nr:hypothetical protein BX266_5483 [Streptomyces sp. TLI_171]